MHRLIGLAVLLAGILTLSAEALAEQLDVLGPDEWPTTVEEVVADLLTKVSEDDKATLRKTSFDDLIRYHFGWGMGIRNYYGLWRGNQELIIDACGKPCHPDDASMKIIEAVWQSLQQ